MRRVLTAWPAVVIPCVLMGCPPADDSDTSVELPPEDSYVDTDTGLGSFPVDTSLSSDINEVPENTVTISQWGEWNLTPFLGPYDTLLGTLEVEEYINGEMEDTAITDTADPRFIELECDVEYSMAGIPVEAGEECTGCNGLTFIVTYALIDGDPSQCHDPDLPADGEQRVLGFNGSTGQIEWNFQESGLWFDWYSAEKIGDQVNYEWTVTVGVAIEEDDDQ